MSTDTARHGQLDDKVVLITGAAQGIGFATAKKAIAEGATVILSDIQREKGAEAAVEIGAKFVYLDVTDAASVDSTVDEIVKEFGRIDVLVNNAGVVLTGAPEDTTLDVWNRAIQIDLTAVYLVTQAVGKHMLDARAGSIVNLSSTAAFVAMMPERLYAYSAAKAAVAQMARTLAVEWAPYGIRANSVAPGRTRTPLLTNSVTPEMLDEMVSQLPTKRLVEPEEIAAAIVFLASDAASGVSGVNLLVDGAFTVQ